MQEVLIEQIHNYLQVTFPYVKGLSSYVKKWIPSRDRRWCPTTKRWFFDKYYLNDVVYGIKQFNLEPNIVDLGGKSGINTQEFLIEYLEESYTRTDGTFYKLYLKNRYISRVDYYKVRQWWLDNPYNKPAPLSAEASNFYKLLEVNQHCETEEIKKSYRRLAIQFHPDTSSEPDAHEIFVRLNSAYEVLINPIKRKKYDAAIAFARMENGNNSRVSAVSQFTDPPVKCGRIKGVGKFHLGLFVINTFLKWQDVIKDGKVMASHFNTVTNNYEITWNRITK
jgi:hypothetical protein